MFFNKSGWQGDLIPCSLVLILPILLNTFLNEYFLSYETLLTAQKVDADDQMSQLQLYLFCHSRIYQKFPGQSDRCIFISVDLATPTHTHSLYSCPLLENLFIPLPPSCVCGSSQVTWTVPSNVHHFSLLSSFYF